MSNIIIMIGCFIIGVVIGFVFFKGVDEYQIHKLCIEDANRQKEILMKNGFIEPKYYGYKGGYSNVTECVSCGLIGLYEDQHPVRPCKKCGGDIKEKGAMIWEVRNNILKWWSPRT